LILVDSRPAGVASGVLEPIAIVLALRRRRLALSGANLRLCCPQ
jgi:hypothetical protein